MNKYERDIYQSGHSAAKNGKPKSACQLKKWTELRQRHWWLAGWHDWHIENNTGIRS